jgi:arylformamidase
VATRSLDHVVKASGRLVDLTLPIRPGEGRFGLLTEFATEMSFADAAWQGSTFKMFAHTGTHIDAPVHFLEGAAGIDSASLPSLVGQGWIFDLSSVGERHAITAGELADADPGLRPGTIAVLRTDWTDRAFGTEGFLDGSPYLTLEAARWLVDRGVTAILYDFSEEYRVREPGFRGEECEIHHLILGSGIYNVEYVTNLGALRSASPTIVALPLKLAGLDGSPARVIAIDGDA